MRVDPRTGSATAYSSAEMILPNASAFDDAGNLYVTDSGDTKEDNGRVLVVRPGGATEGVEHGRAALSERHLPDG